MEVLPNGKCTNRRNQTGLMEGKFLNTIALLGLSMQLCKFYTLSVSFYPFVSLRRNNYSRANVQTLQGAEFSPARA